MAVARESTQAPQARRIFDPATAQLAKTTPRRAATTAEASEIQILEDGHSGVGGELQ